MYLNLLAANYFIYFSPNNNYNEIIPKQNTSTLIGLNLPDCY